MQYPTFRNSNFLHALRRFRIVAGKFNACHNNRPRIAFLAENGKVVPKPIIEFDLWRRRRLAVLIKRARIRVNAGAEPGLKSFEGKIVYFGQMPLKLDAEDSWHANKLLQAIGRTRIENYRKNRKLEKATDDD